jgi:phosphatidylinositol-3-phosphatase
VPPSGGRQRRVTDRTAIATIALGAIVVVVATWAVLGGLSSGGGSSGPAGSVAPATPSAPSSSEKVTASPTVTPSPTVSASPTASAAGPSTAPASPSGGLPLFRHVYLIVLENKAYGRIVGSAAAPYLNRLADRYGLATAWFAVAHPSEPNYLALFSGGTRGVSDDGVHSLTSRTIADQLEAAGRSWRVFAENVPTGCFDGGQASGGPDGPGTYARKHEPAISFRQIADDPARCARITDFSHFSPAAVDFSLIVPNLCHDMHDCSVATGDRFMAGFVPRIVDAPSWGPDDLLVITFDEGVGLDQRVATIVISDRVPAGFRSSVRHDHYSLVRTLEVAWGLGCLDRACSADTIAEFFAPPGG